MLKFTLLTLCDLRKIPTKSLYPNHLKSFAAGDGNATKEQMQAVIAQRFPQYDPAQDDGADIADALALILWARAGFPPSQAELDRQAKKARKSLKACKA